MINPPLPPFAQLSIKLIIERHIYPLGMFFLSLQIRFLRRQLLLRQIMGVLPSRETNDFALQFQGESVRIVRPSRIHDAYWFVM